MFSKTWKTSEKKYNIVVERDVKIGMTDGTQINADIFRPDSSEKFPAIFGFSPYFLAPQTAPIKPDSISMHSFMLGTQEKGNGSLEAGDPNFFVPRGYAQIVANVRGTGKSGGKFSFLGTQESQDGVKVIEWIAAQPWCDGNVGMFGVSYFAWIQHFIASLEPPHLKCIFAPWAATDLYRDSVYQGGILGYGFWVGLCRAFEKARAESYSRKNWGDNKFEEAILKALEDEDIVAVPELVNILKNPDEGTNPMLADFLLNPHDGPYWEERRVKYETIKVPAYIGACWGIFGLHLPGACRSWENLRVPKKMIIGTQAYLDRPVYQVHYEALRWFDYWLKGFNTGIMDEPPIRIFVMGTGEWRVANDWPLDETKWTPFYLHENQLLWEHEHWPNEGSDSFDDSPYHRGHVEYYTPPLVENTEVIGPIVLNLYASTTDIEMFLFASLWEVDEKGNERLLTRGWLRGTHRKVDPEKSKPWAPFLPHTESEPLTPGKIYEFNIPVVPTGNLFRAGSRIKLKICSCDDKPKHPLEMAASGHLRRQSPSRITIYHDTDHPSCLLLPITKGNILETYLSGGKPFIS